MAAPAVGWSIRGSSAPGVMTLAVTSATSNISNLTCMTRTRGPTRQTNRACATSSRRPSPPRWLPPVGLGADRFQGAVHARGRDADRHVGRHRVEGRQTCCSTWVSTRGAGFGRRPSQTARHRRVDAPARPCDSRMRCRGVLGAATPGQMCENIARTRACRALGGSARRKVAAPRRTHAGWRIAPT